MSRDNKSPPSIAKAFDLTTPAAYLKAQENPAAFQILNGIEKRSEDIRQRAIAHYKRFEDRWTAKEAMRLWARHNAQSASHPAPAGVRRDITPEAMMRNASRNVQARTNARLAKINAIQTRMSNAVVRNMNEVSLHRAFNHVAPEKARRQRLRRTQ
jgi:hypothetical protein